MPRSRRNRGRGSSNELGDFKQFLGVFLAGVVIASIIFVLGVWVGDDFGPAAVVPPDAAEAAARQPSSPPQPADDEPARSETPSPSVSPPPARTQVSPPVRTPRDTPAQRTPTPRPATPTPAATPATPQSGGQAPAAQAPERTLEGGYAVQVLAVSDLQRAQQERLRLREAGYPAYVVSSPDDDLHRLRVGNYLQRDDALGVRDALRGRGYPSSWVLKAPAAD